MGITSTSFIPGSAAVNGGRLSPGRQPGSQNRTSYELRERLKQKGDRDPAEFLSGLVSDETVSKELRASASNMLMPYLYNKLAPISPPPTLIMLEEKVVIPHPRPTTLAEARENIAYISELKAAGQIDRAWAESLIFDQRALHGLPPSRLTLASYMALLKGRVSATASKAASVMARRIMRNCLARAWATRHEIQGVALAVWGGCFRNSPNTSVHE
jgi:hypothetical protein